VQRDIDVIGWLKRFLKAGSTSVLPERAEPKLSATTPSAIVATITPVAAAPGAPPPAPTDPPSAPTLPERLSDEDTALFPPSLCPDPYRYGFVDVETTGLADHDRIVSLGLVTLEGDGPDFLKGLVGSRAIESRLVHLVFNPGRSSHSAARKVHGLSDEFLAQQPSFADYAEAVWKQLSACEHLDAHNAAFDGRFLDAEFIRCGLPPVGHRMTCTMLDWRRSSPNTSAKLDAILATIGHYRTGRHHGALEDAWNCFVVRKLLLTGRLGQVSTFSTIPAPLTAFSNQAAGTSPEKPHKRPVQQSSSGAAKASVAVSSFRAPSEPHRARYREALEAIPHVPAYQEAAVCLRRFISDDAKAGRPVEAHLATLHNLAQQQALLFGMDLAWLRHHHVIHKPFCQLLRGLFGSYEEVGYERLPLKALDVRLLRRHLGEPKRHMAATDYHAEAYRELQRLYRVHREWADRRNARLRAGEHRERDNYG